MPQLQRGPITTQSSSLGDLLELAPHVGRVQRGADRGGKDDQLSYIGFGPFLWHAQLMIELNMDTVLAAVNDLHASTGNRIFTLIEIAEAIDGQRVTPPPGMRVTIDEDGNPHPELNPPVPRWVTTLNNILLRLGEEGKLPVEPIAMVAFPPLPPE